VDFFETRCILKSKRSITMGNGTESTKSRHISTNWHAGLFTWTEVSRGCFQFCIIIKY